MKTFFLIIRIPLRAKFPGENPKGKTHETLKPQGLGDLFSQALGSRQPQAVRMPQAHATEGARLLDKSGQIHHTSQQRVDFPRKSEIYPLVI